MINLLKNEALRLRVEILTRKLTSCLQRQQKKLKIDEN